MEAKDLVALWFEKWENGDFMNLPISDNFVHTSPYGTINGKQQYVSLVEANREKFLGHQFQLHNILTSEDLVCVRYTAHQEQFTLEVSEWHFIGNGLINRVIAYYNIEGAKNPDRNIEGY